MAPADRGLVVELRADLLGGVEELGAVGGEQRLVGGDDVGAGVDRLQRGTARRLDAAHELDDDVGAEDERLGVGREQLARDVGVARRVEVAHGDADELEAGARAAGELVAVLEQQRGDLGADGAGAEEGDAQVAVFDHAVALPVSSASSRSCLGLAAHDDARLALAHGDDRRAGEVVVVAGERPAVGAGRGHGEQVARARRRRAGTRRARRCRRDSQCLPATRTSAGSASERAIRDAHRVVGP